MTGTVKKVWVRRPSSVSSVKREALRPRPALSVAAEMCLSRGCHQEGGRN